MARPAKKRRICCEPSYDSFLPCGTPSGDPVTLALDEYEVIRLIDYEKMTQEQCARQMDVSRTTITGIYEAARLKIADCLVNGKTLQISGGNYKCCSGEARECRKRCRKRRRTGTPGCIKKGDQDMRIAVTYEDGNVFQHFGHTENFKMYDVDNQKIKQTQVVSAGGNGHGALAGFLKEAGVDALICGGIGGGAQAALAAAGITLYGGVSGSADDAVAAYLDKSLGYDPDVHCNHHDHAHGVGTCGTQGCGNGGCRS